MPSVADFFLNFLLLCFSDLTSGLVPKLWFSYSTFTVQHGTAYLATVTSSTRPTGRHTAWHWRAVLRHWLLHVWRPDCGPPRCGVVSREATGSDTRLVTTPSVPQPLFSALPLPPHDDCGSSCEPPGASPSHESPYEASFELVSLARSSWGLAWP